MSSRPIPPQLQPWALAQLAPPETGEQPVLQLVTGDASNRRYFRLQTGSRSYIVAEAPPETEKNEAFLAVRDVLAGLGVRVPEVLAADLQRGYLLLEDLGDQVLLPLLNADTVDDHYAQARGILLLMADAQDATKGLPGCDRALLAEELSRFGLWFVEALLEYSAEEEELALTAALSEKLIASALEQPQVLVHRDFHSRNLMPQPDGTLAVIDFQDAVTGPLTYDLASLLRDCYIQWPAQRVNAWALAHRDELQAKGLLQQVSDEQFLCWFDWMGLQRHIKVLGTFARLYLRDGKSAYLADLPLVITYVREILHKYANREPEFAAFSAWFDSNLLPLIKQQSWGTAL